MDSFACTLIIYHASHVNSDWPGYGDTTGVFGSLVASKIYVTSNIYRLIRSIKYKLITKLIIWMEANFRDEFFKPN